MNDSTSQPSSRAAKSGKFALLSGAIKHSDIHLEVLFLQNRKSFEYFLCFHGTLGISPNDLERFKADIAFRLHKARLLAGDFHKFEHYFDFCKATFHWFVRYQTRDLFG